jgi:hypothetical protein
MVANSGSDAENGGEAVRHSTAKKQRIKEKEKTTKVKSVRPDLHATDSEDPDSAPSQKNRSA